MSPGLLTVLLAEMVVDRAEAGSYCCMHHFAFSLLL